MQALRDFFPRSYDNIMQQSRIKLYFSHYSPPARAVYLVCKALNLNVTIEECDVFSKNFITQLLRINPQHTIPTLQDDEFVIWESHAISGYLVNNYGPDDALYPYHPKKRAVIDQRLHFDTEHLFPRVYESVYPILFKGRNYIPRDVQMRVKHSYGFLEKFLQNSLWLAGDELTIADLCCVSSLSTLDYLMPISRKQFPNLSRYMERMSELPYYYEANQLGLNMLGRKLQERLYESHKIHNFVKS